MGTPHKHAALIKAWADGAEIEFRSPDNPKWRYLQSFPCWHVENEYRIKPVTVKSRRYLYKGINDIIHVYLAQDENSGKLAEKSNYFIRWIDTEWQEHEV